MQNINTLYWLLSCLTNSEIQVSLFVMRVFLTKQEKVTVATIVCGASFFLELVHINNLSTEFQSSDV